VLTVGTVVWLASELMFFSGLFAAYFTIRAVSPELWAQETEKLNVPFSTANTAILVASSFACQWGVFAAERGQVGRTGGLLNFTKWGLREWFILTYVMGAVFIGGQALEYAELIEHGRKMVEVGYFPGARAYFQRAAEAGSGEAAFSVGATYDPWFIGAIEAQGSKLDTKPARLW